MGIKLNIGHQNPLSSRNSIFHMSYFSSPQNSHFGALEALTLTILSATKGDPKMSWGGGLEVDRGYPKDLLKLPARSPLAATVELGGAAPMVPNMEIYCVVLYPSWRIEFDCHFLFAS